jgi:hypothetical protein
MFAGSMNGVELTRENKYFASLARAGPSLRSNLEPKHEAEMINIYMQKLFSYAAYLPYFDISLKCFLCLLFVVIARVIKLMDMIFCKSRVTRLIVDPKNLLIDAIKIFYET